MDYIFLRAAQIISSIKKNGPIGTELRESDDIALNYMDNIVYLLKNGNTPEYINFIAMYEFNKILNSHKLDDIDIKKICIVKELVPMIVNVDEDAFLNFSNYFCNETNNDAINVIMGVVSESNIRSIIENTTTNPKTKESAINLLSIVSEYS